MASTGKIRVLIVDDIAESRDNVAKLLRFEPDVEIVGTAENGQTAIDQALRLQPDVILMDINMPGMDGITAASRISGRLPNTAVIMMSVQNEPDYLRRSMIAGAREFLAKPFSLDELIESVRHVHQLAQANRRVVVDSHDLPTTSAGSGERARVVTVFSLKGGVGRSTIAANLAVALRGRGEREVILLDGNLLNGDLGVMLNLTENRTISDVVKQFATVDRDLLAEVLVTHSSGVRVMLAPPDPQSGEQVTTNHVRHILQHLSTMVGYIVIDTRPSFDEATIAMLDLADVIILVMTLELTAIKAAKQYLELIDLLGYDADKIMLVVNRATAPAGIPVEDVATGLKGALVARIPDDPILALRAINEGVPFCQSAPNSPLSQEIRRLATLIASETQVDGEANQSDGAKPVLVGASGGSSRFPRFMRPAAKKRA